MLSNTYHTAIFAFVVLWTCASAALPTCSSDRPGEETHRTVYVPKNMLSGDAAETSWADALCCVYTHVQVLNKSIPRGKMRLFDGSTYRIKAGSFEELAEAFMDDICDMSMGREDCRKQKPCVEAAFASSPTVTESPTKSPIDAPPTPTNAPPIGYQTCSSNRPGWATHRTVYVPKTMMSGDDIETAWTEALCCVYTYVKVLDRSGSRGKLRLFDGSSYKTKADSYEKLAEAFMDDICDMSMGREDCRKQKECVDAAFAKKRSSNIFS